jgi:hypothetical protein
MRCALLSAVLAVFCASMNEASAQQPVRKDTRSFSIQCRLTRQVVEVGANGRSSLEKTTTTMPDLVAVENTRIEYTTERKSDSGIYQFRVALQIQKVAEGKVRIDMQLEDIWSDGPLDKPVIHRHALQTTRQSSLGSKLKIALQERNDKEESIFVELTVKELMDDE